LNQYLCFYISSRIEMMEVKNARCEYKRMQHQYCKVRPFMRFRPLAGSMHLCVLACAQDKVPAEVADIGFKQAMQQKWRGMDKSGGAPRIVRKVGVVRWRALGG
jgi:hypothetical protein